MMLSRQTMTPRKTSQLSKRLSWLLRHGARETGIAMDPAGWVSVADAMAHTDLSRAELEEVVRTNTKRRIQLDGERVRACQGHSLSGTPVTLDALEESWERWTKSEPLFHGTFRGAIEGIAKNGLRPQKRTHVHLAPNMDSPVGKRSGVGLVLEIDPAICRGRGRPVFEAPNGVILVRAVPRAAIVELHPVSRNAKKQADGLRAKLGLA